MRKSRQRNPGAPYYGGYMLLNPKHNSIVFGGRPHEYSADLEDIVEFLSAMDDD